MIIGKGLTDTSSALNGLKKFQVTSETKQLGSKAMVSLYDGDIHVNRECGDVENVESEIAKAISIKASLSDARY